MPSPFGKFNLPIRGSIVDVVFIVLALVVFAWIHYHHGIPGLSTQFGGSGIEKRAAARVEYDSIRAAAQDEIHIERDRINDKFVEIEYAEVQRDSLDGVLAHRRDQIPLEVESIREAQDKSQRLTAEFLRLRGRLGSQQDKLREARLEVENLTATAGDLSVRESALRDTVFGEDELRATLSDSVDTAREYRTRDPWSVFPVSASLAAFYEFSDQADFVTFSLAKDVWSKGKFDFGLNGNVEFGNEQGTSQLELGIYTNYELMFRRASLDVGVGGSQLRTGTESDSFDPYVMTQLRIAPYYKERAFLLLGGKYSHETLSGQIGLAFGRR